MWSLIVVSVCQMCTLCALLCVSHRGGEDYLADPTDTVQLMADLRTAGVLVWDNLQPEYEHLDFTWGIDAHQKIYPDVVALLVNHSAW